MERNDMNRENLIDIWKERMNKEYVSRYPAALTKSDGSSEYCHIMGHDTFEKLSEVTRGKSSLMMGFLVTAQMLMMRMMSEGDNYMVMVGMGSYIVPCIGTCNGDTVLKDMLNSVMCDLKFLSDSGHAFTTVMKYSSSDLEKLSLLLKNTVTLCCKELSVPEDRILAGQKLCVIVAGDRVFWRYDKSEYSEEEITFLAKLYEKFLSIMTGKLTSNISSLEMVLRKSMYDSVCVSTGEDAFDLSADIMETFLEISEKHPDRIAVISDSRQITYKEAAEYVRNIAAMLKVKGVLRGDVVGLYCENTLFTILTIWGIYYLGAVYLPIDKTTPEKKRHSMLIESHATAMVSERVLSDIPVENIVINMENVVNNANQGFEYERNDELYAYVMFTSGSTGKPKGIFIKRGDVLKMCICYQKLIGLNEKSRCMFLNNYNFDGSIKTLYTLFFSGAVFVCGPQALEDVTETIDIIQSVGVTHVASVPLMIQELINGCEKNSLEKTESIRCFISGGESFRVSGLKEWLDARAIPCELWNIYGPAECTCFSSVYLVDRAELGGTISIGRPVKGKRIYILNGNSFCPPDTEGELCIAGWGLAEGYFNCDGFPTEKDYLNLKQRMYRTGDMGVYRSDGNIIYLGRRDRQLKLSGQRVETGEIENAVCSNHSVKNAVVLQRKDENKPYLVLIYECVQDMTVTPEELRAYLEKYLYASAIPNRIVNVEKIPVNANGKTDYDKAAELVEELALKVAVSKTGRSETVKRLIKIWEKVLGKKVVSIHATFFEMGGYSLLLYKIMNEVNKEFNVNISLVEVMENSSVSEMAKYLRENTGNSTISNIGRREKNKCTKNYVRD